MNFLAPLFLLGALAVAAPILFHLIRRTTREKTRFSSLLFLQPDPPRVTRRSRIENWLLLLLRAGALALLAFAFARPFVRTEIPAGPGTDRNRRLVILVDTSASMQREGLMAAAKDQAGRLFREARPGDQIALWAFDSTTQELMDFTQWSALPPENRAATATGRLETVKTGRAATNTAQALTTAAELLAEIPAGDNTPSGGEIAIISDFQEGSRLEGLQGWEWPQDVRVSLHPVAAAKNAKTGNAGLALAPETTSPTGSGEPMARVRVMNTADSNGQEFQVGWAAMGTEDFSAGAQDVIVPPGQSRMVSLPWPAKDQPPARILLKGDAENFDNTIHAAPPVTTEVAAWYFGKEALTDSRQPLFFLDQALPQSQQVTTKVTVLPPDAPLPVPEPGQPVVYFVNGSLSASHASFLQQQLKSGRTVFHLLNSPEDAATLAALTGTPPIPMQEVKPATYGMLSEIDFKHPLFSPFADPRFSDFTKIRFWAYRKFDATALPGSQVPARFDSGDPALAEVPVGEGKLIVLASGWHPADSQLALSSKFVPLLSSLLEWSGALITAPPQFFAGQPIPLPVIGFAGLTGPVLFTSPDGTTTSVDGPDGTFTATSQTGLYTATAGNRIKTLAVNPDPAESRTTPLPADEMERLGVPVQSAESKDAAASASRGPAAAMETEGRQKLWRWIILIVFAVLCLETLLAGLAARRAPAHGGSPV